MRRKLLNPEDGNNWNLSLDKTPFLIVLRGDQLTFFKQNFLRTKIPFLIIPTYFC